MAYQRWLAGELTTATKLNAMFPSYIEQAIDISTTSTVLQNTDITFTPDVSATYYYEMFISYGAIDTGDIKWAWSAAQATFNRFTFAVAPAQAPTDVDTGEEVVMHRPTTTGLAVAAGLTSGNAGFMAAFDRGTFTTTATPAAVTLQIARSGAAGTTIFRGGNNSRFVYQRVA